MADALIQSQGQDLEEPFEVFEAPCRLGFISELSSIVSRGLVLPRKVVHRDGHWHRSVGVWLYDKSSGQVLVQQRSAHKDTFPGFWDMSVAGHVDPTDASVTAALLREMSEELGISSAYVSAPTLVAVSAGSRSLPDREILDNEFKHFFVAEISRDAPIRPLPDEVAQVKWMSLSELFPLGPEFVPRSAEECAVISESLHAAIAL